MSSSPVVNKIIDLQDLNKYMLTENLLSSLKLYHENKNNNEKVEKVDKIENVKLQFFETKVPETKVLDIKVNKKKEDPTFFIPKEKDGLFWCFFIIKNGFSAYEYPGATSFVNEKEVKFKLIESMRTKKQLLKLKKIKNIKEDIEDELANKEKIGMKTFIAMCAADNINILFIHKKKCFELISNEDDPFHIIHLYDNPKKYCYEINAAKEIIDKYRNTYFKWENFDKPLKAMTSYKVDELLDFYKKLGLDSQNNEQNNNLKKKSKKELYESIVMNL